MYRTDLRLGEVVFNLRYHLKFLVSFIEWFRIYFCMT